MFYSAYPQRLCGCRLYPLKLIVADIRGLGNRSGYLRELDTLGEHITPGPYRPDFIRTGLLLKLTPDTGY